MYIWNLPAGVRIRDSVLKDRDKFAKSLFNATDRVQTISAADTFMMKTETWILELHHYAIAVICP